MFVLRQRVDPKGIAAGHVTSEPEERVHFADKKKTAWYSDVRFDSLLPLKDILQIDSRARGSLRDVLGLVRASGTSIVPPRSDILERMWHSHLTALGIRVRTR